MSDGCGQFGREPRDVRPEAWWDQWVIARKERPHPGAQLRLTDVDGHRVTCFATRTRGGQLADLELRHRRRARCEDRIRKRQGHRAAQPPAARLRPEPAAVRARRPGRRADRLGQATRPARHDRPPPAVSLVHHGRAHHPRRPPRSAGSATSPPADMNPAAADCNCRAFRSYARVSPPGLLGRAQDSSRRYRGPRRHRCGHL
jgi:hypothetical protein